MTVAAQQRTTSIFTLLLDIPQECSELVGTTIDTDAPQRQYPRFPVHVCKISTTPEVEAKENDWIIKAMLRLEEVASLRHNWDGQGSPGTNPAVIEAAADILSRLSDEDLGVVPAPFVCGISGGGLQFEWSTSNRHLELELIDPNTVVYLKEDPSLAGSGMQSGEYPLNDLESTRQLLSWFVTT